MIILFLLIPLSIVTATIFLLGFIWAVKSGQYEDTCTPALRALSDDAAAPKKDEPAPPAGQNDPQATPEPPQNLRRE